MPTHGFIFPQLSAKRRSTVLGRTKAGPVSRILKGLPESAWLVGKDFGLARASYFTNGELGTGKAEFSESEEEHIFCLDFAFRKPNSALKGGSVVFCFVGPPA